MSRVRYPVGGNGRRGQWVQVEQWSLQGGAGALVSGDVLAGAAGKGSLEYGTQSALIEVARGASGVTFSGITTVNQSWYAYLRCSLSQLLDRAWNPGDSLALTLEFDPVVAPPGSPHVCPSIWRSPTRDSMGETLQGGWEYTSSAFRAFGETTNTSGSGAIQQRTNYTPGAGFDLVGALISGRTVRGFTVAGGSTPADGSTDLAAGATFSGGTTTAGLIGAATGVPDHAGLILYRTTTGTVGTARNLTFWRWAT